MRKIPHYAVKHEYDEAPPHHSDSFNFHIAVVDSKNIRSAPLKSRVHAKDDEIEARFDEYDHAFETDTLESIDEDPVMQRMRTDLQSLYNFKSKPFQALHELLIKPDGVLDDTCPNCDKDSVESFDHLLPQTKFPEFSDHPLNLMPCCSECNERKSSNWIENGKRKYLNLYIDELPDVQYLFCDVRVSGDSIECDFSLSNLKGIDADLFRKIRNHFDALDLCRRYKNRSNQLVTELSSHVQLCKSFTLGDINEKEYVRHILLDEIANRKQQDGCNDWRTLIFEACCNTDEVFDFLYDKR